MFRPTVWHPLARSGPGQTAFRGDNKSLGIRVERLRYEQFACFRPVRVGGVDQVHTEFDGAPQNLERVLSIRRPTPNPFPGDAHRAKAESIDREIAAQLPNGIRDWAGCCWRVGPDDCGRSSREKRGSGSQAHAKKCSPGNAAVYPFLLRVWRFIRHHNQVRLQKPPSTQARSTIEKRCSAGRVDYALAISNV